MINEVENRVQVRAKMVEVLLESNTLALSHTRNSRLSEDVRAFAIILMIASASFFIWYVGKLSHDAAVIMSLLSMALASVLLLLEKLQLAATIARVEGWVTALISSLKTTTGLSE